MTYHWRGHAAEPESNGENGPGPIFRKIFIRMESCGNHLLSVGLLTVGKSVQPLRMIVI
jgi:hypothetical protein